ncbi:hypothetical protein ABS71_08125 [bacterium SCN 62-11]|nr:MAG: hypothetical protein ABS71_08125 [bacterium SCN 62-11]
MFHLFRVSERPRRGAALMVSLMLTVFLLVIGLGLLYYLERDGHASIGMQRSHRAQVLALAGLNYARLQEMAYQRDVPTPPDPFPPGDPPQTFALDGGERFRLWKENAPGQPVHCRGEILDSAAHVVAARELAAYTLRPSGGGALAGSMLRTYWDVDL